MIAMSAYSTSAAFPLRFADPCRSRSSAGRMVAIRVLPSRVLKTEIRQGSAVEIAGSASSASFAL